MIAGACVTLARRIGPARAMLELVPHLQEQARSPASLQLPGPAPSRPVDPPSSCLAAPMAFLVALLALQDDAPQASFLRLFFGRHAFPAVLGSNGLGRPARPLGPAPAGLPGPPSLLVARRASAIAASTAPALSDVGKRTLPPLLAVHSKAIVQHRPGANGVKPCVPRAAFSYDTSTSLPCRRSMSWWSGASWWPKRRAH